MLKILQNDKISFVIFLEHIVYLKETDFFQERIYGAEMGLRSPCH